MSEFYFIRHGETDWNARGLWQGTINTDLNDNGRDQAQAASLKLFDLGLTRIITSPMKRCIQTTEILNAALNLPITESENLRERSFGDFNGKHKDDIKDIEAYDPEQYGIEPLTAVIHRATAVIEASFVKYPNEKILFVSHGGVFRAVTTQFCKDKQSTANCVPHHFAQENGEWQAKAL